MWHTEASCLAGFGDAEVSSADLVWAGEILTMPGVSSKSTLNFVVSSVVGGWVEVSSDLGGRDEASRPKLSSTSPIRVWVVTPVWAPRQCH